MKKRIKYETLPNGTSLALIQIRLLVGLWITIKRIQDEDPSYTKNRAEECLAYLEDEIE